MQRALAVRRLRCCVCSLAGERYMMQLRVLVTLQKHPNADEQHPAGRVLHGRRRRHPRPPRRARHEEQAARSDHRQQLQDEEIPIPPRKCRAADRAEPSASRSHTSRLSRSTSCAAPAAHTATCTASAASVTATSTTCSIMDPVMATTPSSRSSVTVSQ